MKRLIGTMLRRLSAVAALLAVLMLGGSGCENGGGDSSSDSSSFVGTWSLSGGEGTSWYAHFQADGSFTISNNQDGSGERVHGTYTVSDGKLTGPFTNPGTGEGRVECTIKDGVMSMDFIEYWHTPNKVVPYSGTKI